MLWRSLRLCVSVEGLRWQLLPFLHQLPQLLFEFLSQTEKVTSCGSI